MVMARVLSSKDLPRKSTPVHKKEPITTDFTRTKDDVIYSLWFDFQFTQPYVSGNKSGPSHMNIPQLTGRQVKYIRSMLDLSQAELAAKVGVSQPTIYRKCMRALRW
jgi:predicted XRE-type DNA-binding protein